MSRKTNKIVSHTSTVEVDRWLEITGEEPPWFWGPLGMRRLEDIVIPDETEVTLVLIQRIRETTHHTDANYKPVTRERVVQNHGQPPRRVFIPPNSHIKVIRGGYFIPDALETRSSGSGIPVQLTVQNTRRIALRCYRQCA